MYLGRYGLGVPVVDYGKTLIVHDNAEVHAWMMKFQVEMGARLPEFEQDFDGTIDKGHRLPGGEPGSVQDVVAEALDRGDRRRVQGARA